MATAPTRRLRFSLADILLGMLAVCLFLGAFAIRRDQAERQRRSVEWAEASSGVVVAYDGYLHEFASGIFKPEPMNRVEEPDWLRNLLGRDYFEDSTWAAAAYERDFGNDELARLAGVCNVRLLNIEDTSVSDAGAASLPCFSQLELLKLGGTPITPHGLAHLRGLFRLRVLHLDGRHITAESIVHLQLLSELEILVVEGPEIDDAKIALLATLSRLRELYIDRADITLTGVGHLRRMESLESLELRFSLVTEQAAAALLRWKASGADVKQDDTWSTAPQEREIVAALIANDCYFRTDSEGHVKWVLVDSDNENAKRLLVQCARLSRFRELTIGGLSVNLDALTVLEKLPCIRKLHVWSLDAGADHVVATIARAPAIENLRIRGVAATDEDMAHLARMSNLRSLYLTGAPITDAGLRRLRQLKQLKELQITGAAVTAEAVSDLQQELPDCKIEVY